MNLRVFYARGLYLLFGCIFLLSSCSKTPDEEQIKNIIGIMSKAVESGNFADIGQYLHEDFRANGEMDARQVKQMLMMYGMQHHSISVTIISSKTTIDPVYADKAESTLSVIATGPSFASLANDGSVRVVKLEWRKDGEWKVLRAGWQD